MGKPPKGAKLKTECERLGIDTKMERAGTPTTFDAPEAELQRRWIETRRSIREGWFWLFALISMGFSMISAAAAWYAAIGRK